MQGSRPAYQTIGADTPSAKRRRHRREVSHDELNAADSCGALGSRAAPEPQLPAAARLRCRLGHRQRGRDRRDPIRRAGHRRLGQRRRLRRDRDAAPDAAVLAGRRRCRRPAAATQGHDGRDGLQSAAQGAAAILVLTGQARVWELLALAAARGVGLGLYYPASQGLLPQTVPADQRAQANAISRTGRSSAGIAGAALGGVLVGVAGPGWGLAVDAASFAVATALRAGMRFPALALAEPESALRQMREGWREFVARRWLWTIVLE